MVKMILYVVLCLALFGAGLGLSIFMGKPQAAAEPEETDFVATTLADVVPTTPSAAMILSEDVPKAELPVPVRGESLTAEELFRFGAMYREQQDLLNRREQELMRRQSQLELIHNDMLGSQKEFDGLRAQIQDIVKGADRVLNQLQSERQQLIQMQQTEEQPAAVPTTTETTDANRAQLRKVSSWVESMPPEKAASYLRELSNDGRMSSAVELLGHLEERNTAKILAAMEDPVLVMELTEAFRNSKTSASRVANQPRQYR